MTTQSQAQQFSTAVAADSGNAAGSVNSAATPASASNTSATSASASLGLRTRHRSGTLPAIGHATALPGLVSLKNDNNNTTINGNGAINDLQSSRLRSLSVLSNPIWEDNCLNTPLSTASTPPFNPQYQYQGQQQQLPPIINVDDQFVQGASRLRSYSNNNVDTISLQQQQQNLFATIDENFPSGMNSNTSANVNMNLNNLNLGLNGNTNTNTNMKSNMMNSNRNININPMSQMNNMVNMNGGMNSMNPSLQYQQQSNRPRSQTYAAPLSVNSLYPHQILQQQQQQQQQQQSYGNVPQQMQQQTTSEMARASSFSFPSNSSPAQMPSTSTSLILQDKIPEGSISITSTHTNPMLGPTNTLLFINVPKDPQITNSSTFYKILKQFGPLQSVRSILCKDSNDIVVVAEFMDIPSSINCKATLNNYELYPGMKCQILFARILELNGVSMLPMRLSQSIVTSNGTGGSASGSSSAAGSSNPIDFLNLQINSLSQSNNQLLVPNIVHNDQSQSQSQLHQNSSSNSNTQSYSRSHSNSISRPHSKSFSHMDGPNLDVTPFKHTTLNELIGSFRKVMLFVMDENENSNQKIQDSNQDQTSEGADDIVVFDAESKVKLEALISNSLNFMNIKKDGLGPLPPPIAQRKFDNPSLREIRKQLDQNVLSTTQIDEISLAMDEELPELASDYLGNTIVQKLVECSSPEVREIIVKKLTPYLSQMSAHKNGTWVAQKLINTITSKREMEMVSQSLKPYTHNLFNDTYANYVIHGVLKFDQPYSYFIFEALVGSFLEVASNRFGARAARTCLETIDDANGDADFGENKELVMLVCVAILTWCWELMTDVNGSLLATWFLETCHLVKNKPYLMAYVLTHEREFTDVDADTDKDADNNASEKEEDEDAKFVKLCTLKLGTLSVLKIVNCRNDLRARDLILTKIFGSDVLREESLEGDGNGTSIDTDTGTGTDDNVPRTLSKILNGGGSGCNFIHKILSIPSLEVWIKRKILVKIRLALQDVVIENNSMRRLAEECGVRNGNGNGNGTVNGNGSVLRSGHRSSVASVGGWNGVNGGGRSRSNSAATMESPPRGVSAGAGVGAGVDYDLLLRQQLGDLTLNASGMNENGNAVQMNMNMMNNLMLNNMNMGLNMNMLNGNGGGNGSYGS